jgi:hypothetical protein
MRTIRTEIETKEGTIWVGKTNGQAINFTGMGDINPVILDNIRNITIEYFAQIEEELNREEK